MNFLLRFLLLLQFNLLSFVTPIKEQRRNIYLPMPSEYIFGCWFVPHSAPIKIKFFRNKRFEFTDYNSVIERQELLKGRYSLSGNNLTLFYDDRASQKFRFYKGASGDNNYYIRKSGYYFVKRICE